MSIFTTGAMILNFVCQLLSLPLAGLTSLQLETAGLQRLLNGLTLPYVRPHPFQLSLITLSISCILTARFLLHIRFWEDERRQTVSSKAIESTQSLPVFHVDSVEPAISGPSIVEEFRDELGASGV